MASLNIPPLRIALFGKPGAGKGTQAEALKGAFGLAHLSSGEILRSEIREGTLLGRKVEQYVLRGEIGPEDLITEAIIGYIERKHSSGGYALDGFPRTLYQAEELDGRFPPDLCLLIDISDEEAVKRLSGRYTCVSCEKIYSTGASGKPAVPSCERCGGELRRREDDTPEVIRRRLRVYMEQVVPVISRYREKGLLETIDGALSPRLTGKKIASVIAGKISGNRGFLA